VADKKRVKRSIKQLQRIKTWQLVLLLILALLLTATFLRLNNIGMIQRRTAVIEADKNGDAEITQARLFDLQRYSAIHMNSNTGVVYLESQYRRDTQKAVNGTITDEPDDTINLKADRVCKRQYPGYSYAYTQCVKTEVAKYPPSANQKSIKYPNPALYRNEFASPIWSPDFAGFSVILSGLIVTSILLRFIGLVFLRLLLRRHYSSI
jgi:hypothetical protein